MTPTTHTTRILVVAVSLLASAAAFAGQKPKGRDDVSKSPPNRGILHGIDLARFRDLQVVEEEVPADVPTVVLLDDATRARGRAASHVAETFVYRNFSEHRNNQTGFFFNWAATSGGSDPEFSPAVPVPGIFHADGAIFGGGFQAGKTAVSSYEIFAYRSIADPDTQDLASVSMELWDGDPLNAFDSTGVGTCSSGPAGAVCEANSDCDTGTCVDHDLPCLVDADCVTGTCTVTAGTCGAHFTAAPIPGTKVTFSDVPVNTRIVFRGELDPPVVTPHDRVWVVVTSDACRFVWFLAWTKPIVGDDDQQRLDGLSGSGTGLLQMQIDTDGATNGLGVCCGDDCDGTACDLDGPAGPCCADPEGIRNMCVDGDAEDAMLVATVGSCDGNPPSDNCANFWLNIMAQAAVTMTLQPTGNGALGALAPGARIEGNEIIMEAGGEHVMFDIQITNFAPQEETFCVGGDFDGAPCTDATEVADCGAADIDANPPSFGCGLKLRAWQTEIGPGDFRSGIAGELISVNLPCTTDADCVAAFGGACSTTGGVCTDASTCPLTGLETCEAGSSCWGGACDSVYITAAREDYVFRGLPELSAAFWDGALRWGSSLQSSLAIRPPNPFPADGLNLGQLILTTSADATGTFTINLKPVPLSLLLDAQSGFIDLLGFVPAKVTISTGQCCNTDLAALVCLSDQVTAPGCAAMGIDNGFTTTFDPSKTCADPCPVTPQCFPTDAPVAEPTVTPKNRYLSFVSGNLNRETAVRVTFVDLPPPHDVANGRTMWLGPPETISEDSDRIPRPGDLTFTAASLQCEPFTADWSALGTIHIYHKGIIPGGAYEIREVGAFCALNDPANLSAPLAVGTSPWGDVVSDCTTTPCGPPNGTVDVVFDAVSLLDKFRNAPGAVTKARADLEPTLPDQLINITDITRVLDAFGGAPYPFAGPGASDPCAP